MKLALLLLLSTGAAGALLKDTFLRARTEQSESLRHQSHALDKQIQKYAASLEPGPVRDFLKTLHLCAPCNKFERFGEPNDGGYVMCADGLDKGIVGAYSYGINGFDGWGMGIASRYHIPLHEYDCTNGNHPQVCEGCEVHFNFECIAANNAEPRHQYKTMTQQFLEAGNADAEDRSLLLKIDVEAAEWEVFANEPVENMRKFREIVVEYHWLNQLAARPDLVRKGMIKDWNNDLYVKAVQKIEAAGFAVAHLHGNNYGGGLQHFGEYSIPNVLEVTYIQKPEAGCAANIPYHVPLDSPNNAAGPEIPDATLPTSL